MTSRQAYAAIRTTNECDDVGVGRDVGGGVGGAVGASPFEAAAAFTGPRHGAAFKLGSLGLGYYADTPPQAAAPELVASKGGGASAAAGTTAVAAAAVTAVSVAAAHGPEPRGCAPSTAVVLIGARALRQVGMAATASTMPSFLNERGYTIHQVGVVLSLGLGGATVGMFLTPSLQVCAQRSCT